MVWARLVALGIIFVVLGIAGWIAFHPASAGAPGADWKLSVVPPPGIELPSVGSMYQSTPEISPDGTMILCRLGDGLHTWHRWFCPRCVTALRRTNDV